jgi:hypothetical protein
MQQKCSLGETQATFLFVILRAHVRARARFLNQKDGRGHVV